MIINRLTQPAYARRNLFAALGAILLIANTVILKEVAAKHTASAEGQQACAAAIVEFVQITIMRLDAGTQIFEAYRILHSGMVEWARWDNSGHLLAYAEPRDMGSGAFDRAVSSPGFQNPPKPPQDDGALGRPGFRLDMAILSGSGIDAVSMNEMPDDMAELTDEIRRGIKPISVQPGWYIWTQPYPPIGEADIDIAEARGDSTIARLLSESAATGRLIVRADERVQAFVSGERANRIAFEARFAGGNLLFGVLSAK